METWQGKHFSITDPKGVNTVIYEVYVTKKEYLDKYPKYTMERLNSTEQIVGEMSKKTFYVEDPQKEGNRLVIFSFAKEKVIINNGILMGDEVKITKKPMPFKYNKLYSEEPTELKEVQYTPNLKRAITIIDPETAEEIRSDEGRGCPLRNAGLRGCRLYLCRLRHLFAYLAHQIFTF